MDKQEEPKEKQKIKFSPLRLLEDSLTQELIHFGFEICMYYPELFNAAFLKITGLGKCQPKYCNHGDFCDLSKKFLVHKWLVGYFCKIKNCGPDEEKTRYRGMFHSYIGCSPQKKQP